LLRGKQAFTEAGTWAYNPENREKTMKGKMLFLSFVFFAASGGVFYAAAEDNISSLFTPPLTKNEMAEYKKISGDNKKVKSFSETRQFVRKMTAFVAEIPQGVEYSSVKHGAPQPTAGVDITYAMTFDEQLKIFDVCMTCGGCGGAAAELAPTGHPLCGIKHPKQYECGKPAEINVVLSQLDPPATPQEKELFAKANNCAAAEIPRFLATRKYMREIGKLKAALPGGKKFDPDTAPRIPALVDSSYFLSGEVDTLMEIQQAEILKDFGGNSKTK
jgi:hypothetical protein